MPSMRSCWLAAARAGTGGRWRSRRRYWRSCALTRDRERLVSNQRDVENQLRAIVLAYHPAVLGLFSSLDRDITLSFLRYYPTPA
jgi:hypothetical protein